MLYYMIPENLGNDNLWLGQYATRSEAPILLTASEWC